MEMNPGMRSTPAVVQSLAEATTRVFRARASGQRVGLVPTMGALHAGHASLVEAARRACDVVITTIFVNPTQFGPNEDFQKYPRTLDADLSVLREAGADWVFVPSAADMYPAGSSTTVEPPRVASPLEGQCRPGHFRGVATVVLKLFQILPADVAYFGAKDYQQALVIRHMAADLNVATEIQVMPTVRDPDGLAMSSRNRYLSADERSRALGLSRALRRADELFQQGESAVALLERAMHVELNATGVDRIEYAVIADPDTLEQREFVAQRGVALIAARVGTTRLIDNRMLERG